jgi:DNA-binding XRE family transcriptional regulator
MNYTAAASPVPTEELSFTESLRERLPQLREKLGLTQQDLAALLGVPPGTVNRWENGRALPSFKNLLEIYRHAAAKGVDPRFFPIAGYQAQGLKGLADAGAIRGGGVVLVLRTASGPGVLAKVLAAIAQEGADVRAVNAQQPPDSPASVEVLVDLEGGSSKLGPLIDALHATNVVKELSYSTVKPRPWPV